jgi:hypothetical protein
MALVQVVVYDLEVDSSGNPLPNLPVEVTLVQPATLSGPVDSNVTKIRGLTDSAGRWQPAPFINSPLTANSTGGLTLIGGQVYVVAIPGKRAYLIGTPTSAGTYQASSIIVAGTPGVTVSAAQPFTVVVDGSTIGQVD